MKFTWSKHCLQFKTPSGTSRGVLNDKDSWLIQMTTDGKTGIGECSIIEGLSPESPEIVEDILEGDDIEVQTLDGKYHIGKLLKKSINFILNI